MSISLRETLIGQWLTEFQGQETLLGLKRETYAWKKLRQLSHPSRLLIAQVKPQLESQSRGEIDLEALGHRTILKVFQQVRGEEQPRQISMKAIPTENDWKVLSIAQMTLGEDQQNHALWTTFSLLMLCIIQRELGWIDIVSGRPTGKRAKNKGRQRYVILTEEAAVAIGKDAHAWAQMGWYDQPMLTPPEKGDYLTVKHRPISNRAAPSKHSITKAEESWQWETACDVLASTPWRVNSWAVQEAMANDSLTPRERVIVADHARLGNAPFWLPIMMDFRGRVYPRTATVSYQGSDLQKSLLMFNPLKGDGSLAQAPLDVQWAVKRHMICLEGKWDKSIKQEQIHAQHGIIWEEPHQFWAHRRLIQEGLWNSIPIQIDGTCNGLQHISAMFADEVAAPCVNLCNHDAPQDIYGKVAKEVEFRLNDIAFCADAEDGWAGRLLHCGADLGRKLMKKPVMTLPYGATMRGVADFLLEGLIEQKPSPTPWRECLTWDTLECRWVRDSVEISHDALAFADRELARHPLFRADVNRLSAVVWKAIEATLPRAMAAMSTFRKLAGGVGEHVLAWETGPESRSLVVRQAKAQAYIKRMRLMSLHLPNSIRTLQTLVGRDEVDARYHRNGIIANFIHSQDADHMARTMRLFRKHGGTCFGAAHDCFSARAMEIPILHWATRMAFLEKYAGEPTKGDRRDAALLGEPANPNHPLNQRISILDHRTGAIVSEYDNWYRFADAMKVSFPDRGSFDLKEVLGSEWFFS
jgi:hypothetical protein